MCGRASVVAVSMSVCDYLTSILMGVRCWSVVMI